MQERHVRRVGYIIVSTDRGLCGGLNINLFKPTIASIKNYAEQDVEADLCLLGGKAIGFFNSYGGNVVAAVRDLGEDPAIADLIGSIKVMLDAYENGTIDRLSLSQQ